MFVDGVVDGRPQTLLDSKQKTIDKALLTDIPVDDQEIVVKWICYNFYPVTALNYSHGSYGLKHILQRDTGIYLTENQFKDAMRICGFKHTKTPYSGWHFNIAKNSPAFRLRERKSMFDSAIMCCRSLREGDADAD